MIFEYQNETYLWNFLSISMDGDQNLKRRKGARPIFRNFEIANTKMKKDELFDNFIFELFFFIF